MSYTNFETKEIHCKIIYLGAREVGKTETLRSLFRLTHPDAKKGHINFVDPVQPTDFFDFLPISLGTRGEFHIKLHLFTLPNPLLYPSACGVILKGVDAFVFVADSHLVKLQDNQLAWEESHKMFQANGYQMTNLPGAFQYNRRDQSDLATPEELSRLLNVTGYPEYPTVASKGIGTLETLHSVTKQMLKNLSGHQSAL